MYLKISVHQIVLCLSPNDTHAWAFKPNSVWPCSRLRGQAMEIEFDRDNGDILDIKLNDIPMPDDIPSDELTALLNDMIEENVIILTRLIRG